MIRSPATLTIANFNRQTLADLLRPVLDRAMTQGMVGTNVVLEIVAELASFVVDSRFVLKKLSACQRSGEIGMPSTAMRTGCSARVGEQSRKMNS